MARRSASNPRYQKHHEPAGQTRKSAAAAKPSRGSSSAPVKKKSTGKSTKGSSATKRRPMMANPTTPEFKRIRTIWWALLGGGLVLTTVSWAIREFLQTPWASTASNVVLGLAYAAIFYALFLDWTKMRPMRQAAYKAGAPAKAAEKPAADKPAKGDGSASKKTKADTDTAGE